MRQFLAPSEQAPLGQFSVFLGGTINGSTWRDKLIPQLQTSYFNPVVENWTAEDKVREEQAKSACGILMYTLSPKMKGFFTIAEIMTAVFQQTDKKLLVLVLPEDDGVKFEEHQLDSLRAMAELALVHRDEMAWVFSMENAVAQLNKWGSDAK